MTPPTDETLSSLIERQQVIARLHRVRDHLLGAGVALTQSKADDFIALADREIGALLKALQAKEVGQ